MEHFEKVKLTDANWEDEHERFASFEEHIKNIDREKKTAEMIAAINNLEDPNNKNLATYLLGQKEGDVKQSDVYRLIGYISNYEKTNEQVSIIKYLDQMLDHEEDVSMEPRDPDIDSSLYAYSVGLDISEEIKKLSEKYDGLYDDEVITNKATIQVLARCILDDTLHFPLNNRRDLEDNTEYIFDCYGDYLESIKCGEEIIKVANKNEEQQ